MLCKAHWFLKANTKTSLRRGFMLVEGKCVRDREFQQQNPDKEKNRDFQPGTIVYWCVHILPVFIHPTYEMSWSDNLLLFLILLFFWEMGHYLIVLVRWIALFRGHVTPNTKGASLSTFITTYLRSEGQNVSEQNLAVDSVKIRWGDD